MAHKITLTGIPVSPLRITKNWCSFDMEEKGSPAAPKGLPLSSTISYTVFLNQKQLKKAGLTAETMQEQKLIVQGEPTLDVSVEDCPGEIGVVCFQLSVLPEKKKETPSTTENTKNEVKETAPKVTQKKEKQLVEASEQPSKEKKVEELLPLGTEDFMALADIKVPEEFLQFTPNPVKTQKVIDYVKQKGQLDEPIEVDPKTNMLTDGYRRYIVATELKMERVPVVYNRSVIQTVQLQN